MHAMPSAARIVENDILNMRDHIKPGTPPGRDLTL